MIEHITNFETDNELQTYSATTEFRRPHVSYVTNIRTHFFQTMVDLGLPSGTKWATTSIGSKEEINIGNYYQYGKGASEYSSTSGESAYDGTEDPLASSADTATQVWKRKYRLPSRDQFNELINNTTYSWVNINGIYGGKFSSVVNTNYVFFPANGYINNGNAQDVGSYGYYWSSTPDGSSAAYGLSFNSENRSVSSYSRSRGCGIRSIIGKISRQMHWDSIPSSIAVGETFQIAVSIDGGGTILYSSSDNNIATINQYTGLLRGVNFGSCVITALALATDDYEESSISFTLEVGKSSINPTVTMYGWTYGDTPSNPYVNGNTGGGTVTYNYKVSTAGDETYTVTKPSDAGTYTVRAQIAETENYGSGTCQTNFTISKANGRVISIPGSKSMSYNGSSQELVTAGSGTGTMMYKLNSGSWSTSIPTASAVGTYTIYYKAAETTNYTESPSGSVTSTIANQVMTYTAPTPTNNSYNGSAINLASGASASNGTIQYSTSSDGSYSTTIPTATNAGSYSIWWKAVPNSGYGGGTSPAQLTSTITKINPSITQEPYDAGRTYNGSAQYLLTGGTANISGSFSYSTATNAGTYTATWSFTPSDTTNYNSVSGSKSANIYKRTPTITQEPYDRGVTYNGSAQYLLTGGTANISGSFSYSTATNAGTYTATWSFTPSDTANYNSVSGSKSATILKAPGRVTIAPTPINRLWTGNYQTLVTAGESDTGTMMYKLNSGSWSTSIPTASALGSYSVWFKASETANYTESSSSSVPVYITFPCPDVDDISSGDKTVPGCASSWAGHLFFNDGNTAFTETVAMYGDGNTVIGAFYGAETTTGNHLVIITTSQNPSTSSSRYGAVYIAMRNKGGGICEYEIPITQSAYNSSSCSGPKAYITYTNNTGQKIQDGIGYLYDSSGNEVGSFKIDAVNNGNSLGTTIGGETIGKYVASVRAQVHFENGGQTLYCRTCSGSIIGKTTSNGSSYTISISTDSC